MQTCLIMHILSFMVASNFDPMTHPFPAEGLRKQLQVIKATYLFCKNPLMENLRI